MKKNIILSFILFASLTMVSVYGQDDNSNSEENKGSEGSIENAYGPKKGDFTAEILFGKGTYITGGLNVPNAFSTVSGSAPVYPVNGNYNDAGNMIGAEFGYYISNRVALILSGGTILRNTPVHLGVPAVFDDNGQMILPAYSSVVADEGIDVNVTLGIQYLFETSSKKLFPYIGVSLPYNYARRSTYDPTVTVDGSGATFSSTGAGHVEINAFGIQAVAGVDYYISDEVFIGARIVPMAYNYAFSTKYPGPGLPDLEADTHTTTFFVQPTISLGFNFGPKDRDGDGVLDKNDACPDVAGLEALNGCPDTDGDGVIDSEDACPEVAGLVELNGCPDTDGDGIADNEDRCPYTAGSKETWGCPDYDGDGVLDLDENDHCPGVPGPKENNGCPWPDTDGDGVLDKDDKCIDVPGPADNDGCPLISASASDLIDAYAKSILFQTGKASFQSGIADKLDEIAIIMNDYPKANFLIEGHTDNTGSVGRNQELSEQRANAVLNYLTSNGNVSSDRLVSEGRGESSPEFDNNTSEGRSNNRRVLVITTNN